MRLLMTESEEKVAMLIMIIMMMIMMMIPDLTLNIVCKKVYTSSRHNSSVVEMRSGGKRNDHVKEHHQADISHNTRRRGDGGRVVNTGALIASGDGKELPTTIHPSSYGTHGLLISGNHDDNNAHHVRGL